MADPRSQPETAEDSSDDALDSERLDALRRLEQETGEPVLRQVVTVFLQNGDQLLALVRDELRTGRLEEVADAAHSLAGSAAAIGATTLAQACQHLEQHARRHSPTRCLQIFEQLAADYRRAADALQRFVQDSAR